MRDIIYAAILFMSAPSVRRTFTIIYAEPPMRDERAPSAADMPPPGRRREPSARAPSAEPTNMMMLLFAAEAAMMPRAADDAPRADEI